MILFLIAKKHLKRRGRLVFWMPVAGDSFDEMEETCAAQLQETERGASSSCSLVFLRSTQQELSGKLSRYLCIYERL